MVTDKDLDKHLAKLEKSKPLEDYCTGCGDCCFGKVKVNVFGKSACLAIMDLPCRFLDVNNPVVKSCTVYPERHEKAHWCQDLRGMLQKGLAPAHCPYVFGLNGYEPTQLLRTPSFPEIRKAILFSVLQSDTSPFSDSDIGRFVNKYAVLEES